jgi:hypothetical protein
VFRQVIHILELCTVVLLFSKQRGGQVCLPWYVASFVCIEVQAKGNGLEVLGRRRQGKSIRIVRNKEMPIIQLPRNI